MIYVIPEWSSGFPYFIQFKSEFGLGVQNEPGERQTEFCKTKQTNKKKHCGHSKHPLPTTQEKTLYMDITRWSMIKSD